ncbi:hypothetical protein [Leptotrichia trevisanii]|uniref:hypothetical protein n=1 Tax=Leptotrichia trevisanii TaxID=109328 RepID=UPI0026EF2283|nr:hypothetical protein [Leptotrichia trevisanii]
MQDRVYKFAGMLAAILYMIIVFKEIDGAKNFLELIKVLVKNAICIGAGCFVFAIGDKN